MKGNVVRVRGFWVAAGIATALGLVAVMWLGRSGSNEAAGLPKPSAHLSTDQVVVVTGANRGLGLAFVRQLKVDGAVVIATARNPEAATALHELGVEIIKLDVTSDADVVALAEEIGTRHVDMLINNAGITGPWATQLDEIDPRRAAQVFDVNVIGPMRVTRALLPALRRGSTRKVINISSWLGSFERFRAGGGGYGYRESKAALNMFTKSISAELRQENFTCVALNPGWVRTDMGGPNADLSPEESVAGMLSVIATLTPDSTGNFYQYDGKSLGW